MKTPSKLHTSITKELTFHFYPTDLKSEYLSRKHASFKAPLLSSADSVKIMDYLKKRLIRWDLLREKMNDRPSFTDGTTIWTKLTMATFAGEFSRSPIECEVSNLSLDEMLIFLLHTLSHYLRKKCCAPCDMTKFCTVFDIIFNKILTDPEILLEDEKRIMLANLFIIIEECCTKLLTPLNLRFANTDLLNMDKLSQNVRDIMKLIKHHPSDVIPFKILCAATHNIINRFEERSEFISQFKDWRFKNGIINEKKPEYSAEDCIFSNAQENLFNRTYFAIMVKSNGTVTITKAKIHFFPTIMLQRNRPKKSNIKYLIRGDVKKTLCTFEIMKNERKLAEYNNDPSKFESNQTSFYKMLKSFSSDFWKRRHVVEKTMSSKPYFGVDELDIIFRFIGNSILLSSYLLSQQKGDIMAIKKYMKIFYSILNSLSLVKILPWLNITPVVFAAVYIHFLYQQPAAEPLRQESVKLLMILSKLAYFLAPTIELKACIQTFSYKAIDRTEYLVISIIPMLRTPKELSEDRRQQWRGFMSRRGLSGREAILKQNDGECSICRKEFTGDNFFILSCCHPFCESCLLLLINDARQRFVSYSYRIHSAFLSTCYDQF